MSPRNVGRVADMTTADVHVRADAAKFLEVAQMVAGYGTDGLSADKTAQALRAAEVVVDQMEAVLRT